MGSRGHVWVCAWFGCEVQSKLRYRGIVSTSLSSSFPLDNGHASSSLMADSKSRLPSSSVVTAYSDSLFLLRKTRTTPPIMAPTKQTMATVHIEPPSSMISPPCSSNLGGLGSTRQSGFSYGLDFLTEPSFIFKLHVACIGVIVAGHMITSGVRTSATSEHWSLSSNASDSHVIASPLIPH